MTPEQIKAWQDQHGGPGGPSEGPDANGITVHRAADGSFINVRRDGSLAMQGRGQPSEASPPAPAGETPAAPAAAPPGSGGMSQAQLEALLKQIAPNGDPRRLEFNQGTRPKTVRSGGGIMGAETTTVQAPYVQWIDRATGQTLEADVEQGGSYTVTFNGKKEANQGAAATTAAQAAADQPTKGSVTYETRDGKKVKVTKSTVNGVTSENVEPVTDKDRTAIGTREVVEGGKRVKYTKYRYPDGSEEEVPTDTQPDKQPELQQAPDKSWGYVKQEPGQPPQWVPVDPSKAPPGAPPKVEQVNGVYGIFGAPDPNDPDHKPRFITVEVPKPGATLKNVDEWQPDFTQPDLGLGKWSAAQRGKIGLPADQGGITQDDYDNAVKEAHGRAGTAITNITNATTTVRQRQQDEENIRSTRSSEADTDFGRAMGAFTGLVSKGGFDPNSGSLKNVIPGLLWEMNKNRRDRENQAPALPGLHPMFQIASAQSAATAQPPAAKEQAAATGPEPAPYQPPGAPDPQAASAQAEAERQRAMAQANAAPAAPAVPAPPPGAAMPPAAAPVPTAAPAMAAPPPAPAPAGPAPIWQPATPLPPAPIPGALPGASPVPSDLPPVSPSTLAPTAPPGPPDRLSPGAVEMPEGPSQYGGGEDMQRTSLGQGPLSSFAASAMTPSQPPSLAPQQEGQGGPFDGMLASAAGGGFDPVEAAARLVSLGAPRDVIAQVLAQSGMLQQGRRVA